MNITLSRGDNSIQINKTDDFYRRRFTSYVFAKVQKSKWKSQAFFEIFFSFYEILSL